MLENRYPIKRLIFCVMFCGAATLLSSLSAAGPEPGEPFIPNMQSASTVPANGDLNPYGVAFVPPGFPTGGPLISGDILVSNFNAKSNIQGTGSTIVRVTPSAKVSLFFSGSPGLGLTTALGVLKLGFVLVGSLPAGMGMCKTTPPGMLIVINKGGKQIRTITDSALLNGPWDLTIIDSGDRAKVFVANVLSGAVTRLDLDVGMGGVTVARKTQIASGYMHRCDPAALVIGPTGLAFDANDGRLFVASTGDNSIFAVANAAGATHDNGKGNLIYHDDNHLRGPLGLAFAPNGDLLTTNGDAVNPDPNQQSEIVEFTVAGKFVAQMSVDPAAAGAAFGLAAGPASVDSSRLAAVDDNLNTLDIWTLQF